MTEQRANRLTEELKGRLDAGLHEQQQVKHPGRKVAARGGLGRKEPELKGMK